LDGATFDRISRLVGIGVTRRSAARLAAAGGLTTLGLGRARAAMAQDATPAADACPTTGIDENKALIERYWAEVWTAGGEAAVPDLLAEDEIHHWGVGGDTVGLEDFTERLRLFLTAFPDIAFTVDQLVAEGDLVVSRWTARATHQGLWLGVEASGTPVEWTGTNTFRIACGKIAESWGNADHLGLLNQLGDVAVVPRRGAGTPTP
jgi:steroid delta-isomerase-like uncharacterized protein